MIGIAEQYSIIPKANAHWQPKKNMPAKFTLKHKPTLKERMVGYNLDQKDLKISI